MSTLSETLSLRDIINAFYNYVGDTEIKLAVANWLVQEGLTKVQEYELMEDVTFKVTANGLFVTWKEPETK